MTIGRLILAITASLIGIVLVLPAVIVGLPFWTVAFLTRIISDLFGKRAISWQQIIESYPSIGWKPKGNLDAYAVGQDGEVFHFTTDRNGWRGKITIEATDIVVFGDSFAFGYGASDKTFFANLNHKPLIKTVGANGYNMVQSLLWMEKLSSHIQGKFIVWFIYYGNDLYENLVPHLDQYRMPYVRQVNETGEWEIITDHVSPDKWIYTSERKYYDRLSEICSQTFLSQRAYSACECLIKKASVICKKAGAHLVVTTIPEAIQMRERGVKRLRSLSPDPKSFDPDLPDKKISEICLRLGVQFVALKDHLTVKDYRINDCHWNGKGHRRVAQVLCGLYNDHVGGNEEIHAAG